jgi:hypothetical protein
MHIWKLFLSRPPFTYQVNQICAILPSISESQLRNLGLTWAEPRGLLRPAQIDKIALEGFQRSLWLYRKENGQPLAIADAARAPRCLASVLRVTVPRQSFARQSGG